jgi:hypothetical protein
VFTATGKYDEHTKLREQNRYSLHKLFSDPEYCKVELCRIREIWGDKSILNQDAIDEIRRTLGFMLLFCDDKCVQNAVDNVLLELSSREFHYFFLRKESDGT